MHTGYWWESQKERDNWKGEGGTILKWILERQDGIWIGFI
jgi:hypothetical protein